MNGEPRSPESADPRIGVVVAVYNSRSYIEDTLQSLRAQDFTGWTCIVVDDCSPDDSADLVRAVAADDPRIQLISSAVNGGQCEARNIGLAALPANIPYVTFLDGDDLYTPTAFTRLLAALEQRPDAVGVFGLAEYIDVNGAVLHPGRHIARQRDRRVWTGYGFRPLAPGDDSTFEDLIAYNPAWPPSVALVRAETVRAAGGWDRAMAMREDWDLFVRLSRYGPMAMLDEQVVWYRRHDENLTKDRVINDRRHAAVYRKTFDAAENTPAQRRLLRHLHRRQLLASAKKMFTKSVALARGGELGNAALVAAAATWTVALSTRGRPPAQDGRRIPLSHAGHAAEPWLV